jgi:hypothetical protein
MLSLVLIKETRGLSPSFPVTPVSFSFFPLIVQSASGWWILGLLQRLYELHIEQRMPIDVLPFKGALKFTKSTLIIWISMLLVLLSAGLSAYVVRINAAGVALSNGKEAYFFINRETDGYHVKWIGYPLTIVGEILGRIEPPDDVRGTIYVIRITSSTVEQHVLEQTDLRPGSGVSMLTPIGDRIWTNYPGLGGLCWWAGDHFERATQEELHRLDGINHLDNDYYRDRRGWSKASVSPGQTSVITLGDGTELSAYDAEWHYPFLIERQKRGREPTTVFSLDIDSGFISRSGYKNAFRGSQ